MCVQQLNADAAIAVDVVDPRAVNFSVELAAKWWYQLYCGTDSDINVNEERGAAAADLGGLGLGLKSVAGNVRAFYVQIKFDRNSRAAWSLGRGDIAARVFLTH